MNHLNYKFEGMGDDDVILSYSDWFTQKRVMIPLNPQEIANLFQVAEKAKNAVHKRLSE